MSMRSSIERVLGIGLLVAAFGCGSSGPSAPSLSFTTLHPWDGGADAGCTISPSGTRVGCATAYPIEGDPSACPGFDATGTGSSSTCIVVCNSGLVCTLTGLSDGTNAVDCSANCASPEH